MGVLTRQQGEVFVITSDRATGAAATARPPARLSESYEVWSGTCWTATKTDAVAFASIAAADEYVRANLAKMLA